MTNYDESLSHLEKEHILFQKQAIPHLRIHWLMFCLAFKHKVWKEFIGQIPRMILAVPGSVLGLAPAGNVGSTKMGIFEIASDKS